MQIALGRKLFCDQTTQGILFGFDAQSCEAPAPLGCNNRSADPLAHVAGHGRLKLTCPRYRRLDYNFGGLSQTRDVGKDISLDYARMTDVVKQRNYMCSLTACMLLSRCCSGSVSTLNDTVNTA